jgi:hypothetical protein
MEICFICSHRERGGPSAIVLSIRVFPPIQFSTTHHQCQVICLIVYCCKNYVDDSNWKLACDDGLLIDYERFFDTHSHYFHHHRHSDTRFLLFLCSSFVDQAGVHAVCATNSRAKSGESGASVTFSFFFLRSSSRSKSQCFPQYAQRSDITLLFYLSKPFL